MAEPGLSDETLVQRAQKGDLTAFDALVARHYQRVFALAFHLLGNTADAADATQETFLRAFEHLGQFRGTAAFTTWLYRIAVNVCRDLQRRNRPMPFSQLDGEEREAADTLLAASDPDPAEEWQRRERREAVRRLLQRLPEELRQVLVLCDLQGLTYAEAAAVLSVPEGTVKSRLHRARHAFKDLWLQAHGERTVAPERPKGGEDR